MRGSKFILFLALLLPSFAHADDQTEIESILAKLNSASSDFSTRLESVSRYFVGRPYLSGGPLGEGASGQYDEDPLYRTDGFDCTTFIETTISLARAKSFPEFYQDLLDIRYFHGQISFTTRNHFVELDWNPNNIAAGIFEDESSSLGSSSDHAVVTQPFSKREWYQHMTLQDLKLPGATSEILNQKLDQLHHEGDAFADVTSKLPYVHKESLLKLKSTLPVPAVLNIVRTLAGTAPNTAVTRVTHQVLLVKQNGELRIRQASSKSSNMRVTDSSFDDYVKTLIDSANTVGVNILKINSF